MRVGAAGQLRRRAIRCSPSPNEECNERQTTDHEHNGENIEQYVEAGHSGLEQDPFTVPGDEIGFDLVRCIARAQLVTHNCAHLFCELGRGVLDGFALTYGATEC